MNQSIIDRLQSVCALLLLFPVVSQGAEVCPIIGPKIDLGEIDLGYTHQYTEEISGIEQSKVDTDRYYAHEDSPDQDIVKTNRFVAVSLNGEILSRIIIPDSAFPVGTDPVTGEPKPKYPLDNEDIAVASCVHHLEGSCIYLADIGNNGLSRHNFYVYVIKEPDNLETGATITLPKEDVIRLRFKYPNNPSTEGPDSMNAEAFFVDENREMFLITKNTQSPWIYRIPDTGIFGAFSIAEYVGSVNTGTVDSSLHINRFTAADYEDGVILSRSYFDAYYHYRYPGESLQSAMGREPCVLPVENTPGPNLATGEAIALIRNAFGQFLGYLTSNEGSGDLNGFELLGFE